MQLYATYSSIENRIENYSFLLASTIMSVKMLCKMCESSLATYRLLPYINNFTYQRTLINQ